MAEAGADNENDDKRLADIFLEGWDLFEELESSSLSTNSSIVQEKVKLAMANFEKATRIVSQIGMFSSNELIDEVTTESLQYFLLPYFLGKLTLKIIERDRGEVLDVAEVYFDDFLKRCSEYELIDNYKGSVKKAEERPQNEMAELMQAADRRNAKLEQFRRKKELEEYVKKMKCAVREETSIDEELRREFFIKFLKLGAIDATEEMASFVMEKQLVQMRKMHMAARGGELEITELNEQPTASGNSGGHGHSHSHHHHHHNHSGQPAKPKPLQPFIITRNAVQKTVFGMGYPSLPVMTVDEFYTQRVHDGIFPDEEKVKQMNAAQALAAAQDPNEVEDQEKAVLEEQIENDDEENLARMRRMDEYKDVVRRGDGNRHNRS